MARAELKGHQAAHPAGFLEEAAVSRPDLRTPLFVGYTQITPVPENSLLPNGSGECPSVSAKFARGITSELRVEQYFYNLELIL